MAIFDKVKERAKGVQSKVSEGVGKLQVKAGEELQRLSESVETIAPVLEALGYEVMGARITLGLPPAAAIGISGLAKPVDPEAFEALLAEHDGNNLIVAVLKALQHIVGVQNKVRIKGMRADMAEITLGLPPSVSLMFEREGRSASLPTAAADQG